MEQMIPTTSDSLESVDGNHDPVQNSVYAEMNSCVLSMERDEEVLASSSTKSEPLQMNVDKMQCNINEESNIRVKDPLVATASTEYTECSNNASDVTSLSTNLEICSSENGANKHDSVMLVNPTSEESCITGSKKRRTSEESEMCGQKRKRQPESDLNPSEEVTSSIDVPKNSLGNNTLLACRDAACLSISYKNNENVVTEDSSSNYGSAAGDLSECIQDSSGSATGNVAVSFSGSCPGENGLDESSAGPKEDKTPDGASDDKCLMNAVNIVEISAVSSDNGSIGATNKHDQSSWLLKSTLTNKASSRKKLLILDINGLLVDIVQSFSEEFTPDTTISGKAAFKRPFCDDFLQFCFEKFEVGIWSSRTRKNVESVVDFLLGSAKNKLLFCWDQSHCTETGYNTLQNQDKPLVLKEIRKLWNKDGPDLPWEKGDYNESNTLLLDDSPYKGLCNPPYTAIFPYPYEYRDIKDRSLGPKGNLRIYLGRLANTDNVQTFVRANPFGQRPITRTSLSWPFYAKIVGSDEEQSCFFKAPMPMHFSPRHEPHGPWYHEEQSRFVKAPTFMHWPPRHDPPRMWHREEQSRIVKAPTPVHLPPRHDPCRMWHRDHYNRSS